jgi:hypothetical protein
VSSKRREMKGRKEREVNKKGNKGKGRRGRE